MKIPPNIIRTATVSECGRFRYRLGRRLPQAHDGCPTLLYVMLNPSTADADVDDATIRRCFSFALAHGFMAFDVVNLFAYRATKPADLKRAGYPVGPENDAAIVSAATDAGIVCVAWGAIGTGPAEARVQQVMPLLTRCGHDPRCLRITRSGYPQHPLMLPSACTLTPFTLPAIQAAMTGAAA